MKKILLILLMIFSIPAFSQKQRVTLKWGSYNRDKHYGAFLGIFPEGDKKFFTIRDEGSGNYIFETFDRAANRIDESEIELSEDKKFRRKANRILIRTIKGKHYMFLTFENKETDNYELYIMEFTSKGFKEQKMIYEYPMADEKREPELNMEYLNETDQYIIRFIPYRKRKELQEFQFVLLDGNFKKVRRTPITLPEEKRDFNAYSGGMFDAQGNYYQVVQVKQEKGSDRKFDWELRCYDIKSGKIKNFPIQEDGYDISDIEIRFNHARESIIMFAFLSKNDNAKGKISDSFSSFLYREISTSTGEKLANKLSDVPKETLAKLIGERRANRGKEVPRYFIDHVIWNEKGGCTFLAENRYSVTTTRTMGNGQTVTTTTYYYMKMLTGVIDANGSLVKMDVVDKYQATQGNLTLMSYLCRIVNNQVFFLYNDDEDNYQDKEMKSPDPYTGEKSGVLVVASIDETGKVTKKSLGAQEVDDDRIYMRTNFYYSLSANEMMILASTRRGKYYSLGIIKVE